MDTAQVLLLTVVGLLTVLLLVLGIQVFLILKEFKNTLSKANRVLDDAGVISSSISTPVGSLSTILSGVKIGSVIASFLRDKKVVHSAKKESHYERE